jgi:hypothetical protein
MEAMTSAQRRQRAGQSTGNVFVINKRASRWFPLKVAMPIPDFPSYTNLQSGDRVEFPPDRFGLRGSDHSLLEQPSIISCCFAAAAAALLFRCCCDYDCCEPNLRLTRNSRAFHSLHLSGGRTFPIVELLCFILSFPLEEKKSKGKKALWFSGPKKKVHFPPV